jgi:hypothetical protein
MIEYKEYDPFLRDILGFVGREKKITRSEEGRVGEEG